MDDHDEEFSHGHEEDAEHGGGHDGVSLAGATKFQSIGIDIGSATSHFVVSEIFVGKRDPLLAQKPEVLERRLIYQSPIIFTPFLDQTTIDADELERFLREECASAGLALESMDTGALICTGEAARKENAAAISERLSMMSGRFVCATAGHHLEAMLGAYGSGAVAASHEVEGAVVTLDIGGGTAKRTLLAQGKILHTAALNVGTRLLAWDERSRVTHLDQAGAVIAKEIGIDVRMGETLEEPAQKAIAERMSGSLLQYLGFEPMDALTQRLFLTEDFPPPLQDGFSLMVAGGFSEYFYGRESLPMGDLGAWMSRSFRERLSQHLPDQRILGSESGIRATVIGAGQFSIQVSGETIWLDSKLGLPLRNIPIYSVPVDWNDLRPESVHSTLATVLQRVDPHELCGLSFRSAPYYGYGIVHRLAEALASSLTKLGREQGIVFVFQHNVARAAGSVLSRLLPDLPLLCVDEIEVGDLEYLDIGEPPPGSDFVPVVVKSLVFS